MPVVKSASPVAHDPIAAAIEGHLRDLEAAGHGTFSIDREGGEMVLAFGQIEVRGATFDTALLRLASALLDSVDFCPLFLARMRNPARHPPDC